MSSNVALVGSSSVRNLNVVECSSTLGFVGCVVFGRFGGTVADVLLCSVLDVIFACWASVDGSPSSVRHLFVADLDFGV